MLIRCIRNALNEIPPERLTPEVRRSFGTLPRHHLTPGTDHVVYAHVDGEDGPWFYVADDTYSAYPMLLPEVLFEVRDPRASRHWQRGLVGDREGEAFAEWIADPGFYDKLIDGDPEAMRVFAGYKEAMDLEFPVASLSAGTAVDLGDGWLMCPACDEAWDGAPAKEDGMARCPRCGRVLLSPLYRGDVR